MARRNTLMHSATTSGESSDWDLKTSRSMTGSMTQGCLRTNTSVLHESSDTRLTAPQPTRLYSRHTPTTHPPYTMIKVSIAGPWFRSFQGTNVLNQIWSMKKNEEAAAKKKPKTSAAQIRVQKGVHSIHLLGTCDFADLFYCKI